MIQTRPGGFAGHSQAAGMHQHAGFYAQRLGGFLERGFERTGVKRGRCGKGVAEFFQARFAFGDEILLRRLGVVFDFVGEIKSGVGGQFAEQLELALARVERGLRFRVMTNWKMPRGFLSIPRQTMPTLAPNRSLGIAEVELGFDEGQGRAEGKRCLNCQVNTIFDGSKCILCNGCVDICPEFCLRLVDLVQVSGDARFDALMQNRYGIPAARLAAGQAGAILKNEDKCIRCGLCADRCPTGAITMESLEQQVMEVFD